MEQNQIKYDKFLAPIGIALLFIFHLYIGWQTWEGIKRGSIDFGCFYAGAMTVKNGSGELLHDVETQTAIQRELFPDRYGNSPPLVFNHLAYETLFWVPLTFLPFPLAALTWLAINLLLIAAASSWLHRENIQPFMSLPWFVVLISFSPSFFALLLGQDSVVLFILYILSFIAYRNNHTFLAGSLLCLGLFKFHLIVPIVAIMILQKNWRFVMGFAVVAPVLLSISLLIVGYDGMMDYLHLLTSASEGDSRYGMFPSNMPNLRGLLSFVTLGSLSPKIIALLTLLLSGSLLIWVGTRRNYDKDTVFVSAILVSLLVSFHIYAYDLMILVLPATVALRMNKGPLPVLTLLIFFLTPVFIMAGYAHAGSLFALGVVGLLSTTISSQSGLACPQGAEIK